MLNPIYSKLAEKLLFVYEKHDFSLHFRTYILAPPDSINDFMFA